MTLLELVQHSAEKLSAAQVALGHGTTNTFDEAAWLVLWGLGLPLDTPLDAPDSHAQDMLFDTAAVAKVHALIDTRILSRKPTAYLTHEAWLQGHAFYVDERVIIPRSLIAELLVNDGLDYWLAPQAQRALDLCTGNGSLAVLTALTYPQLVLDASDICADALAVARINVQRYDLQSRVHLLQSNGWQGLTGFYDLIVCNPPYVNAQSMASLPAEYLAEPTLALDGNPQGGSDGMDLIRTLLHQAPQYMQEDAIFVLEIGNERAHFERAFPHLDAVWLETSAGDDQVLLLTRTALLA